MGLNLGSAGGDFAPYVRYNSKAGRWYVKGDPEDTEVANPTFVADFAKIKTGWILLAEGMAPSIIYDPSLTQAAPKPSDKHKRGFTLPVFSQQAFGGVVEFTSASMHVCQTVNELYAQFEAGAAANPGALPVVQCTGSLPMKDPKGTNFKPTLVILKWVPRPVDFDQAPQVANANTSTPPAQATPQPVAKVASSEF